MCLIHGRNFGVRAISKALALSSKAVKLIVGLAAWKSNLASDSAYRKSTIGIAYSLPHSCGQSDIFAFGEAE
jgi:hypothetical protein